MTWRSHLYYFAATITLAFLLMRISTTLGLILMMVHTCISFRLAHELFIKSFPLRDALIVGVSFPVNIILYFAAIYYQQGLDCAHQQGKVYEFWSCLKVSVGNFIGHLVTNCQAIEGIGTNVAFFEPVAGWASLSIAGIFIVSVFSKTLKEQRG
jgi:hypothetical protein